MAPRAKNARLVVKGQRKQSRKVKMPATRLVTAPVSVGYQTRTVARLNENAGNASLVTREMFQIDAHSGGLSFALPMCPTKWQNTRTAQLAGTYTDFRPLRVKIQWLPSVSTSTAGSVAVGTVWSGARLPSNSETFDALSRTLSATNGGFITTAWRPHTSQVALRTNLRANNFPMYDVDPDDIPFWIVVATDVINPGAALGHLVVDVLMSLKNPVTQYMSPPVAASGSGKVVTDTSQTPNVKYLEFSQSEIGSNWVPGDDFTIVPYQNVKNSSSQILNYMLQPMLARVASLPTGKVWFDVGQLVDTALNAGFTFVGRALQSFSH